MKKWILLFSFMISFAAHGQSVKIGSKKFTESVILSEIAHLYLVQRGVPSEHVAEIGGTRILFNALQAGDIAAYPEYTGTLEEEILGQRYKNLSELRAALVKKGLGMTEPLGFNNTYALGMTRARASALGIEKISDLVRFPNLEIGWGDEFRRRKDGWPGLREKYHLPQQRVRGLDHDVAYRALVAGDIDLIDCYSTDAEIDYYQLKTLKDDLGYFPKYEAVFLYHLGTAQREPRLSEVLSQLVGKISAEPMTQMNRRAKIDKISAAQIAADYLRREQHTVVQVQTPGPVQRIWQRTLEHLRLVLLSLVAAMVVALPLGIAAARFTRSSGWILGIVGVIQTVPSLALLVILMRPLNWLGLSGIGDPPALIALFLYSLLPMVRGAHAGMQGIPLSLRETAAVLGLSRRSRLIKVEVPLALPSILSGIKTAAVMNAGFATLGALVGAGGYGQPILTGIRLDDYSLILEGAIPAAVLALGLQLTFDAAERVLVSPGLRK